MKKWIMSALLAGFVVTMASCSDCKDNNSRGCKRCSSKRCASLVVEKQEVNQA